MFSVWMICLYVGTLSTILGNLGASIICNNAGLPENNSLFGLFRWIPFSKVKTAECGCRIRKGIIVYKCNAAAVLEIRKHESRRYIFPFNIIYIIRTKRLNKHYKKAISNIGG